MGNIYKCVYRKNRRIVLKDIFIKSTASVARLGEIKVVPFRYSSYEFIANGLHVCASYN